MSFTCMVPASHRRGRGSLGTPFRRFLAILAEGRQQHLSSPNQKGHQTMSQGWGWHDQLWSARSTLPSHLCPLPGEPGSKVHLLVLPLSQYGNPRAIQLADVAGSL